MVICVPPRLPGFQLLRDTFAGKILTTFLEFIGGKTWSVLVLAVLSLSMDTLRNMIARVELAKVVDKSCALLKTVNNYTFLH